MPPWLLAAVVLAVLAALMPGQIVGLPDGATIELPDGATIESFRISAWPLFLLFLRDVALMYLVAPGRGGLPAIVVWLAVAYAVLPSALGSLGLPEAALVLLPVPATLDHAWWQIPGIIAQVAVLAALAWWRTPRMPRG
jgi:hypothetical protein